MADDDSLAALQGLHRDICALIENRLPALDRLLQSLENHLEEFKTLVDKKGKNDTSRQALASGKITIGDTEYEVNDDFKQQAQLRRNAAVDALLFDEVAGQAGAFAHGGNPVITKKGAPQTPARRPRSFSRRGRGSRLRARHC